MPSLFFFCRGLSVHAGCHCAVACKLFFIFSAVALCVAKKKNVLANALA